MTRVEVFKNFMLDLCQLSKCEERHVAAVITDKNLSQVYSIGINGGPIGQDQCMCKSPGKYGCVHAEINALVKCYIKDKDKVMFVSLSPCISCAAAIINDPDKFSTVYYVEDWKDKTGIEMLERAGIRVHKI